ncbi:MAG TPA: YceH family protein [Nitrososphaera sp.]|nr:YceH family protein [Nitrososphaera sp.]
MSMVLNQAEARVLGSLIEKDITTPDYYPLSLNSLINACNQKSNREPVMTLDEDTVRLALRNLQEKRLAGPASGADSRVTKYEHRLQEVFNFNRRETAILCVLLLRGAQTPGELRGRTERMHRFDDLSEVQSALQGLMQREPSLAKMLPRQPGTKEARYMHLLCGDVEPWEPAASPGTSIGESTIDNERIERLENEVATLRKDLADLKQQVEELLDGFTSTRTPQN